MTPRKKNRDVAIVDQANIDTDYKNGGIDPSHVDLGSTTPPDREADAMANAVEDMMSVVGGSGTKMFGGRLYEEYNPKLTGLNGLTLYDEMRRSDAQVHACLLALELPIRSTMWYIEPGSTINAEGEAEVTDSDREIKEFLEKALFEQMETTFDDLLRQILSMCTF